MCQVHRFAVAKKFEFFSNRILFAYNHISTWIPSRYTTLPHESCRLKSHTEYTHKFSEYQRPTIQRITYLEMTPSIDIFSESGRYAHVEPVEHAFKAIQPTSIQPAPKSHVLDALLEHIQTIDHDVCDAGDENSFFVADLGEVKCSYQLWQQQLPMVHAHYAVKCNTDRKVIETLGNLGANFDCASKNEIDIVLGMGYDASRIVYANPCKTNSFIRHAKTHHVNLTTVDNCQELHKLQRFHPDTGILVRIATDDETAQCRLSTKFGCLVSDATGMILPLAKELGLNVVGVAFHVGLGAKDFSSIYKAVQDSRVVFDCGLAMGFDMDVLDIGGGFERDTFMESSATVRHSLKRFFPEEYRPVRFIAEPGRFMVANAFTLATHVIARRDLSPEVKSQTGVQAMVYINDGVYGNLNCILFDHQHPTAKVLVHKGVTSGSQTGYKFSIWGPTCDGLDCVAEAATLGCDVEVGDWIYFENLGAYTSAATTSFNGFQAEARVFYV